MHGWCVVVIAMAGCNGSAPVAPISDALCDLCSIDGAAADAFSCNGDGCNVNLQTGCPTGDECGWLRSTTSPAYGCIGCAPAGTVATGGACTWGANGLATGFDNCTVGNYCAADATTEAATGICTPFCSLTGDDRPCATRFTCNEFPNVFANAGDTPTTGLCVPECDLLTQAVGGNSANCGAPLDENQHPTEECVGYPAEYAPAKTKFACQSVLAPPNGSVTNLNGHVLTSSEHYVNSCGPRTLPLLPEATGSTSVICTALCAPGDTYLGHTDNQRGIAPNSLDRTDVSLGDITSTDECRFWWFLETDGQGDHASTSSFSNNLGFAYDPARYTFDGTSLSPPQSATQPVPSCASLTNTVPGTFDSTISDAEFWGCMHQSTPVPLNSPTVRIAKDPRGEILATLRRGMSN